MSIRGIMYILLDNNLGSENKSKRPDQLSKACGFPFKTVFTGSRQLCGLPLPHYARTRSRAFRIDRYLFFVSRQPFQSHGRSRPLPAAQIWMVDQPSFSAGRSLILGKLVFRLLLQKLHRISNIFCEIYTRYI